MSAYRTKVEKMATRTDPKQIGFPWSSKPVRLKSRGWIGYVAPPISIDAFTSDVQSRIQTFPLND